MPVFKADDFTRLTTLYVPETISSVAISPDGALLAVAAGDKLHIHSFNVQADGEDHIGAGDFPRLVTLYMPDKVQSVQFSPDSRLFAVAIADKVHIYRSPH